MLNYKKFNYLIILLALVAFLGSCKDDEAGSITPDFAMNIKASISGVVLDENGDAISGANVVLGNNSVTTNPFGVFLFKGVEMDAARAFIKVNKAGYFLGSRVIKPNASTLSHVRIKLLPKTNAGTFTNSSGGTITSADGVEIVFASNSVALEDGGSYSGTVDVAIQFLDPNATDMFDIMPGDLKGLDLDGEEMGRVVNSQIANRDLAQLPEHMLTIWNQYEVSDQWRVGLGFIHQSEQYASLNNTTELPDFTRVDAAVYYDYSDDIRFQLNVENLFDEEYFPAAHNDNNISTGEPLNARISMQYQF